jgi:hypothetical protein
VVIVVIIAATITAVSLPAFFIRRTTSGEIVGTTAVRFREAGISALDLAA